MRDCAAWRLIAGRPEVGYDIAVSENKMAKVVKCPDGHETTVYVDPDATITLNRLTCSVCGKPIKMLGHRVAGS